MQSSYPRYDKSWVLRSIKEKNISYAHIIGHKKKTKKARNLGFAAFSCSINSLSIDIWVFKNWLTKFWDICERIRDDIPVSIDRRNRPESMHIYVYIFISYSVMVCARKLYDASFCREVIVVYCVIIKNS